MSTLHELRLTLEEHAESIHDDERLERAASVHRRVRAVRRRRVTVASAAAAVVVVAAVAVAGRFSADPEPVPAEQWHGVEVPREVELAAGTYDLEEIRDLEPGREVTFPLLDEGQVERRAVALVASGLGDGTATLLSHGRPVTRLVEGRELSPTLALWLTTLEVELDGAPVGASVGVALYDGPDTLYPQRLADGELVASASAPDEATVEVTVEAALDELTLSTVCSTATGEFTMTIDGEQVVSEGRCSQHRRYEDGSINTLPDTNRADRMAGFIEPEDLQVVEHTIRVERSEPGISVGVYVLGDGPEVLGQQVAETVEYQGRTWTLDQVIRHNEAPGAKLARDISVGAEDRLLRVLSYGGHELELTSELGPPCRVMLIASDVSDSCNPVLLPGDTYHLEIAGDGIGLAGLVYRPE